MGNKTQMERDPKNDLGQRLGQRFISFFPTLSFFVFVDEAGEFVVEDANEFFVLQSNLDSVSLGIRG